jgi:hypothetical protein
MGGGRDAMTTALTGQLGLTLLVAAPLALLVSWLLLRAYLSAVKRAMLRRSGASAEAPRTEAQPIAATPPAGRIEIAEVDPVAALSPEAADLASRVRWGRWRSAAVWTTAGLAYAAAITAAYFSANGIGFLPSRFAFITVCNAWPVVIALWLTVAVTRWERLAILAGYLALLAGAVVPAVGGSFTPLSAVAVWAIFNALPSLLVLAFLARPIRAVGPLVMAFLLFAVSGSQLAFTLAGTDDQSIRWMAETGARFGLGGHQTFAAVALAGALVLGALGWLALKLLGAAYRARLLSDQSIMLDAVWLIFAVCEGLYLAFAGPAWFGAALAAFLLYKLVAALGFRLLRAGRERTGPQLLLLRVFSLGRRSRRLFDGLSTLWRHAGSIRMIAGPDLASSTVEPHEFLDFVGGRLARRFIAGADDLERRLIETSALRDRDGRFRVNDFFCHDDTWKMVLSRLARDSDAVLMDLRGFGPTNKGCVFEVHELLARVPLDRVVLVVDHTTDRTFLNGILIEGWSRLSASSPNFSLARAQVRVVALSGRGGNAVRIANAVAAAAR